MKKLSLKCLIGLHEYENKMIRSKEPDVIDIDTGEAISFGSKWIRICKYCRKRERK